MGLVEGQLNFRTKDGIFQQSLDGGATWATPVPGLWQAIGFGASPLQDVDISNLSGDTDGSYELDLDIGSATGSGLITLSLQPNAVSTGQNGEGFYNNGTTVAANTLTAMTIGIAGETTARCRARIEISSKTGAVRVFRCKSYTRVGTGVASIQQFDHLIEWSDTSTVITSLRIHSSAATSMAISSVGWWRKMNRPW